MTEIQRYARAAREAGCPEDQVREFMAAKVFLARLCDKLNGGFAICDARDFAAMGEHGTCERLG